MEMDQPALVEANQIAIWVSARILRTEICLNAHFQDQIQATLVGFRLPQHWENLDKLVPKSPCVLVTAHVTTGAGWSYRAHQARRAPVMDLHAVVVPDPIAT
jgi:hypothetical protein